MRECEENFKSVHLRRASQLDLATGSRLASCQRYHTCEAGRGAKGSCQLEHYRTKLPDWPGS